MLDILLTGNGRDTGKSLVRELIRQATGLQHIDFDEFVVEQQQHSGWEFDFKSYDIANEDKVCALSMTG